MRHATLFPAQEQLGVALRKTLLLPLDDLLAVMMSTNPVASRSGLSRCLRRQEGFVTSKLLREQQAPAVPSSKPKSFKDYKPGFIHADVKYLPEIPDEKRRQIHVRRH